MDSFKFTKSYELMIMITRKLNEWTKWNFFYENNAYRLCSRILNEFKISFHKNKNKYFFSFKIYEIRQVNDNDYAKKFKLEWTISNLIDRSVSDHSSFRGSRTYSWREKFDLVPLVLVVPSSQRSRSFLGNRMVSCWLELAGSMGPKGEIERLSAGRMEIPLSEGIDGTMFEKFPWSRERYCEKRLIILSLPSSSSSSACTPVFPFFVFHSVLSLVALVRVAGRLLRSLRSLSCFGISSRFRLGIIWLCARDGIKWTLVTIYDGYLGATIASFSWTAIEIGGECKRFERISFFNFHFRSIFIPISDTLSKNFIK